LSVFKLTADSYPYSFLRYNSSARAAGMGGAFEAVNNDPSSIFFNPAGIFTVEDKHFSATYLKHALDINSGYALYVKHFEDVGSFSASAVYSNYGSFDASDNLGNVYSTFGANDLALAISYGNELDTNLYWGAAIKYIYSNIDVYASSAIALDVGLLYNLSDGRTSFAASILNAGFQLSSYNGETESVPLDIRLGANHRLVGLPLLASFSFHHLADATDNFFDKFLNFSIGGEIYFGKNVNVRIGYDNYIRQYAAPKNDKGMSGFSGGIGIITKYFNFDYALSQVGSGNLLNRFTITLDI